MILLVSGATATVRTFAGDPRVGVLFTPRNRNPFASIAWPGMKWAADNGAFSGFDEPAFARMLEQLRGQPGCLFVVAPDVVADAARTFELFQVWGPKIRAAGFPVAFVAQDGLTAALTPEWHEFDALFVGGSTAFKLSRTADVIATTCRGLGLWVHFGRVNTRRRFRHVKGFADSLDGSAFSKWPAFQIPRALTWLDQLEASPRLV